jgi:hypothetical protein
VGNADDVRAYCERTFVSPARAKGETKISIRAGDVHEALKYRNRLPLVCSALGTKVFEEQARVYRTAVDGPLNGANTIFRFYVCRDGKRFSKQFISVVITTVAGLALTACSPFTVSHATIDSSPEWSIETAGRGDCLATNQFGDICVRAENLVQSRISEVRKGSFGISLYFSPRGDNFDFEPPRVSLELPGEAAVHPIRMQLKRAGYNGSAANCSVIGNYDSVPRTPNNIYRLFRGFCADLVFPVDTPPPTTPFLLRLPAIRSSSGQIDIPVIRFSLGKGGFRYFPGN